ncbi:MAG TPA: ATP-binding protein [Candidatus Dormibacteraeota bacterium]|nr:ATP-binding protein [Candidatus Dormibacteraeota bacterium]
MTSYLELGRLSIRSADDIINARQRIRSTADRLGFDLFDQVQIATGVSEIGREMMSAGGGELALGITTSRPQRLVILARGIECRDDFAGDEAAGLMAARRLLGPSAEGHSAEGGCTFTRLLPRPAPNADAGQALLEGGPTAPDRELQRQDAELLRALESVRERDRELESLKREVEETNQGVLALYAELDGQAESVRRASEERSRFLSNVTHELRTPLSSIVALSRLMLTSETAPLAPEQVKQVGYIQKSAQDLLDFVGDLLDLDKVEAGKLVVRSAPFDVETVFTALRGMFRPLSADSNVPIIIEPAPVPAMIGDEGKVSQILRNLVSNAFKFTETGEIRVSALHDQDADEVMFVVADTGIGIASDDRDRIFDEFIQVNLRRGGGEQRSSGLGLPLSRRLAELMGGSLTVASVVGSGSTFTLRIPRVYGQGGARPPADPQSGYVLVVDDDQISRYVAREQLERHGWKVIEAANGEIALQLAREGGCRAIVSDLSMPGMSGFELIDLLAEDPATAAIPVVIRTALPVSELNSDSVSRAAAVFSKDGHSIEAVVQRVATSVSEQSASRDQLVGE